MNVKEAAVLLIRRLEIDANLLLNVDEDRSLRHATS